ncbi:MAG: ABC transporter permease/M1 family aminopeptidase [Rhodanobacteraceae bacterium]
MTFREIFRFELRQQLRSPLFWLIALALAGIAFGAACSDSIQIGGGIGNIHRNAPYVVITMLAMFTILGLFLITIFVAGAALRDFTCNTAELMFATPMSRGAYLGGRFAAGWLVSVLVLIGVAIGMWLGSLMPWLDPARLGPTPWTAYGWGLVVIVLPNLFFVSALLFLLATLTRSMLGAYVGVIAFVVLVVVARLLLGHGNIAHQTAAALMNPFGGGVDLATRYWTASDRNTRVPELTGLILGNRALWLAIGAALLAAAFALFKPCREGPRWFRQRRHGGVAASTVADAAPIVLPTVSLRSGFVARWVQYRKLAWFDTKSVLGGTAFLVMLLAGLANLTGNLSFVGDIYGTPVYPVTHLMAQAMDDSYKFLLLIILIFYAGELVWRERGARVSEVMDAFPTPDWMPLLAKVTALAAVVVVFLAVGSLYCMGFQLLHGFTHLQPLLYLQFLGLGLLSFLLLGILALVFQVWANNKFAGYALIIGWLLLMFGLSQLHFTDNLYHFGNAPSAPYSDMNGFGSFWIGTLWFRAYWYCCAIALLVIAALYWVRGNAHGWRERARIARQRLGWRAGAVLVAAIVAFAGIGGFLLYNTHVLYHYTTHDQQLQAQANYEKDYRKYVGMAQPRITDVNVNLAIYPKRRAVDITGHYTLVNKHTKPIDTLIVQLPSEAQVETRDYKVALDFPAHTATLADKRQGFYLYKLATPLAPGASMPFTFRYHIAFPGFANEPTGKRLVRNGTFLTSDFFPHFCYDTDREIADPNERRKYKLGPVHLLPNRSDMAARADNYATCDADWVHFQATLSTSPDQIALAPGYLQKEWIAGGRRYFHYVQDSPILDFFSFQSARYQVSRAKWHDVNLEVYYDRRNPWNVQRILKAMQLALTYYTKNFGPYQFRQLRILEFPDFQGAFAQSFANTVPFSEDFVLQDLRKPSDIDYLTYVTAHETAHQWWAHQAIGANVRGATMLSESMAQYSALMVMKHLYGPTKMRKFLKYELDRYLSGRADAKIPEQPLALVQNQPYIHYRKASVIMYALQDYIGEDKVNTAVREWLDQVKFQQPPYTTTKDLIADLRTEAGPQYQNLITDFFDKITLFDDRMVSASAKKLPDGKYEVTLHVHAAKYYADGKGKQTRAKTIGIPIEIGVFAKAGDGEEQDEKPLFLEKYPVKDGDSTITVIVDGKPYQAGIDPFNELVDRVADDNRAPVTIE